MKRLITEPFAGSEGSQIINSEFGYLGDVEPGRRGLIFLEEMKLFIIWR